MKTAQSQNSYVSSLVGISVGLLLAFVVSTPIDASYIVSDIWNFPARSLLKIDSLFGFDGRSFDQVLGDNVTDRVSKADLIDMSVVLVEEEELNLNAKMNSTREMLESSRLSYQSIGSELTLVALKWDSLTISETADALERLSNKLSDTTKLDGLAKYWGWPQLDTMRTKIVAARGRLITAKSILKTSGMQQVAYEQIRSAVTALEEVENIIGGETIEIDPGNLSLFGEYLAISSEVDVWNKLENEVGKLPLDIDYSVVSELRKRLSKANKVFQIDSILSDRPKEFVLDAMGIVRANKRLLAGNRGDVFTITWMVDNPMRIKTLVHNSSILSRQEIKVKYWLPTELVIENVLSLEPGLEVKHDEEKKRLFVEGYVTVAASDTRVASVEISDVWGKDNLETEVIVSRINKLVNSVSGSNYLPSALELGGQISQDLASIEEVNEQVLNPEDRIRKFRQDRILISEASERLTKLQEKVPGYVLGSATGTTLPIFGFGLAVVLGIVLSILPGLKRKNPGWSKETFRFDVISSAIDSSDL